MNNLYMLINALEISGQEFLGIAHTRDKLFMIYAFDDGLALSKGHHKPNMEYVRDKGDYNLLYKQWRDAGTYLLYADANLEAAIQNSLDKLAVAT